MELLSTLGILCVLLGAFFFVVACYNPEARTKDDDDDPIEHLDKDLHP